MTGPAASSVAGSGALQPGARSSIVLAYIAAALLALVPGVLLKLGIDGSGTPLVAAALAVLGTALDDITFGSGLRFWLGVSGASMMGLLLLYPVRKALARRRGIGSIGGWFHVHIVIGLLGPVLILYHCNFGHGSANSNVALWTMLVVAVSGIAGFFVYGRVSRGFYLTAEQARRHRDGLLAALPEAGDALAWKDNLVGELETFEAELLAPRRGFLACLRARLKVERTRRILAHEIAWFVDECARRQGSAAIDPRRRKAAIGGHLRAYFALARSAASRSLLEQLWARWRLFHLPVFLVMVIAVVLHVLAVWGMEKPAPESARPILKAEASAGTAKTRDDIEQILRGDAQVPDASPPHLTADATPPRASGIAVLSVKPQVVPVQRDTIEREPVGPPVQSHAVATAPPPPIEPVARSEPAPKPLVRQAEVAAKPVGEFIAPAKPVTRPPVATVVSPPAPAVPAPVAAPPPPPKPVALAAPPPPPAGTLAAPPQQSSAPPAQTDIKAVYSELERRTETPPMALGGAKPRSLAEQIALLKEKRAAGEFAHSQAETGFALTGRHLKVDCASCHTKRLSETPQSEPRQCVACHKNDDPHKGRRPNCVECHTANRWSQIIKRK